MPRLRGGTDEEWALPGGGAPMEEWIVGYLRDGHFQGVWEKEVAGAGPWAPSFSVPLPAAPANPASPLFSGLPILEYQ